MVKTDTKSLIALALFNIDPRSKECRETMHQSIVELTLLDEERDMSAIKIYQKVLELLEQPLGMSREECDKALLECLNQGRVIRDKQGHYKLDHKHKEIILAQRVTYEKDEIAFTEGLIKNVKAKLNVELDEFVIALLSTSFKKVIQRIFHEKSIELQQLMAQKQCDYRSLIGAGKTYDPIAAFKQEINPVVSLYGLNENSIIEGIGTFLVNLNEEQLRYMVTLHHRVFYYQILNIDPHMVELQKQCFQNTKLYLDTNVIVSFLFDARPEHKVTQDILTACQVLNINLLVSPITFNELNHQIAEAKKFMTFMGEGRVAALVTNTVEGRQSQPVLATYLMKKKLKPRLNWGAFIAPYEDLETFLLNLGLYIEKEKYEEVRKHQHYNRVWQTIKSVRNARISDNVISHDADNLVLIHMLREKYPDNPLLGPSVWLLTMDHSLKTDERILAPIFSVEHCRLLEEWGKILLPYQNLNQFVFSDYISYLVASELGALIQIPTLNFNILNIICDPQLSLEDFFTLPIELQIKVIAGMQKDNIIQDLQARNAAASTIEEKTKVADDFRKKELEILAEEKTRIGTQMTQLSQQMNELRQELAKLGDASTEKDNTIDSIRKKLQIAEQQLNNYQNMTVWQKLKKLFDQTK